MRNLGPILVLVLALISGLPNEARASFIGAYDVANWTTTLFGTPPGGGGSVDTLGAPDSITLLGGNSGCSVSGFGCSVFFSIHAPEAGRVHFHWEYLTTDVDGPSLDKFFFTSQGAISLNQLSNDSGPERQHGDAIFPVVPDMAFGFVLACTDCVLGPAQVTISEFSGPALSTVPEPGSVLLLGSSLAGLGYAARRKQRGEN